MRFESERQPSRFLTRATARTAVISAVKPLYCRGRRPRHTYFQQRYSEMSLGSIEAKVRLGQVDVF